MKTKSVFMNILQAATKYFGLLIIIVTACILCSGIRIIRTGNQAVILRMGKIVGDTYGEQVHGPGLLLAFPYIIDEVIIVPTDQVFEQSITTHDSGEDTGKTSETGYVITGDNNIAVVSASVKYTISDAVKYALKVKELPAIIESAVSSSMVQEAASINVDSLLTDEKDNYAKSVLERASCKLDKIDVGIEIKSIELTKVSMPEEVREIYEKVNSATVQVSTDIAIANQYKEKQIPAAQAAADNVVTKAKNGYSEKIANAKNDLSEFWGVVNEYKINPEGVKTRIYSEKVKEFIDKIGTVKIVSDGDTNLFLDPK